jgi:hypothetical protein
MRTYNKILLGLLLSASCTLTAQAATQQGNDIADIAHWTPQEYVQHAKQGWIPCYKLPQSAKAMNDFSFAANAAIVNAPQSDYQKNDKPYSAIQYLCANSQILDTSISENNDIGYNAYKICQKEAVYNLVLVPMNDTCF